MNNPTQHGASRALAVAAGLVIIALTAAAFWLSYAHLAEVAAQHGLQSSPVRAWAWPATLDLFIVAGELLMLRAALAGRTDPWAIGLTVVGSGGSIALNVAGVGTAAGTLDYVVAAVPPTAALLAFGALMRQVHQALAGGPQRPADGTRTDTPAVGVELDRIPVEVPAAPPAKVRLTELPELPAAVTSSEENPQVSTGAEPGAEPVPLDNRTPVEVPAAPPAKVRLTEDGHGAPESPENGTPTDTPAGVRMGAATARAVIEKGHREGASVADTARLSGRSESWVRRMYRELDAAQGDVQVPGQLSLVGAGEQAS